MKRDEFDERVGAAMRATRVPAGLKEEILAENRVMLFRPWWRRASGWAMAASLFGLFALPALLESKPDFAELRHELVEEMWNGTTHLDYSSTNLEDVRGWLGAHGGVSDFPFPSGLEDVQLLGCRLLRSEGRDVTVLCFRHGVRHTHLYVMDRQELADEQLEHSPYFERCGGWETITWSHSDRTFMLSGMKYYSFVKRFRRGGAWTWAG